MEDLGGKVQLGPGRRIWREDMAQDLGGQEWGRKWPGLGVVGYRQDQGRAREVWGGRAESC